jgi:hypothetical protein
MVSLRDETLGFFSISDTESQPVEANLVFAQPRGEHQVRPYIF